MGSVNRCRQNCLWTQPDRRKTQRTLKGTSHVTQAAQQLAWSQQTNLQRRWVVELVHNWSVTDVGFANNSNSPSTSVISNPDCLKQRPSTGHRLKLTPHEITQLWLARVVLTYAKQIHTQSELWVCLCETRAGPITASIPVAAEEVADDDGGQEGVARAEAELNFQ